MAATGRGAPSLARKTFPHLAAAEFASKSELIKLTGHDVETWPSVVKELADNAIDETEEVGVVPSVEVSVSGSEIVVADLARRGITPGTVASIVDYTMRTSSRESLEAGTASMPVPLRLVSS